MALSWLGAGGASCLIEGLPRWAAARKIFVMVGPRKFVIPYSRQFRLKISAIPVLNDVPAAAERSLRSLP